jgi:hypothetical protein
MEFILSHLNTSSYSSNKELLEVIAIDDGIEAHGNHMSTIGVSTFESISHQQSWMKKVENWATLM